MKHIIVTGGAGFIGSHLCDALLKRGYAITAVDNLLTGREQNLVEAKKHSNFYFHKQDICEPLHEKSVPFLSQHGLHGIFHFACPASPVDFDRIPFEILAVDSVGTIHTVDLALRYQSRYLLASTSEVYGDPLVHPQKETYWGNVNPNGPRACYDETKRFAEAYVSTATRLKNLNGGIVRIFNTYGPRMRIDDGRIVPELCRQVIEKKPLTIHGEGLQTRSFCFVSDLVEGIIRLFESREKDPVNIGNPVEKTVLEFAEAVCRVSNSRSPILHLPARVDDPKKRCPDITRAQQILHWSPQVNLEEGLKLSLDYFRTQL
jgi:dTDP-glucose 4,6-dehydratase